MSTLQTLRKRAAVRQSFLCYYCDAVMWLGDPVPYCERFGISRDRAERFRCTAEHLVAREDGGRNTAANIVAACVFCNRLRHRKSCADEQAASPQRYRKRVQKILAGGGWHPGWARRSGIIAARADSLHQICNPLRRCQTLKSLRQGEALMVPAIIHRVGISMDTTNG